MKQIKILKIFTALFVLMCFGVSSLQAQTKFVKKNKVAQKKSSVVSSSTLQGEITNTAQSSNTLTAEQQAEKAQIEYTPTNHDYSQTRTRETGQLIQPAIEQRRADSQQQRLNNVPLDGSLITTNFRTLLNP